MARQRIAVMLDKEELKMVEQLMVIERRDSMSGMIRWCIIQEFKRVFQLPKKKGTK